MIRTKDLVNDRHGLITSWREGGYSDDMLCGGICFAKKLRIAIPYDALFTSCMSASTTFAGFRNYLHRQCFVLGTYDSRTHLLCNVALGALQILASLIIMSGLCISCLAPFVVIATCLTCQQPRYKMTFILLHSVLVISSSTLATISLKRMMVTLCKVSARLQQPPGLRESYNDPDSLRWIFILWGFLTYAAHVPWYTIWAFIHKEILWGDNIYSVSRGRVKRVYRRVSPGSSLFFTRSRMQSLEKARTDWTLFQKERRTCFIE